MLKTLTESLSVCQFQKKKEHKGRSLHLKLVCMKHSHSYNDTTCHTSDIDPFSMFWMDTGASNILTQSQ